MKRFANTRAVLLWMVSTTIMEAAANECTLECPLDAPCTFGSPDFSNQPIDLAPHSGGMHCACPPGWTGVLCDHKFETCNESHGCYHGGECIPGLEDFYGNDQLFCDCTNAVDADGTRYAGKYCETRFEKNCDDSGERFCVNGGDCNPNYELDGQSCICGDLWTGVHCEFRIGEVPDCTLQCQNGGVCMIGVNDPVEAEQLDRVWTTDEIYDHMHCECPPDFGGELCQAPYEECGGDRCYHGGTCVTTTTTIKGVSKTEYHCDCTTASDGVNRLYAGQFCEFESTSLCSEEDENLFCTNQGSCRENPISGCDCPDGFYGFKCEFRTEPLSTDTIAPLSVESCGDSHCFNGGKCVYDDTTEAKYVCDCSQAFDASGFYAGASCQYKSTDICQEPSNNQNAAGAKFCTNGGVCNGSGSCDCPYGWTGEFCEIHSIEEKKSSDPPCGDNVCLNGGFCVEKSILKGDGSTFIDKYCDCSTAYDDENLYAGDSCQFPSTTLCTHPVGTTSLQGMFFCTNHGTCREAVNSGCDCPDGFLGPSCEYEVTPADLNEVETSLVSQGCGDLVCRNGGVCVTTMVTDSDGTEQEYKYCDCSSAVTEKTAFAGDECQYEQTTFCTLPRDGEGLESSIFCVNGGTCGSNVQLGCECPTGWTGLKCEYAQDVEELIDDGSESAENFTVPCGDIFCYNGGLCNEKDEDDGSLVYSCDCSTAVINTNLFAGPMCEYRSTSICQESGNFFCVNHGVCNESNGCDCPSGWTGPKCEIEVTDDAHATQGKACGDRFCYNGGTCVTTKVITEGGNETTEIEHCDCASAFDNNNLYAGESCQHKSTILCTRPEGSTLEGVQFCVNGGTCYEDDVLRGCNCPPGWTGTRCEYPVDPEDIKDDGPSYVDPCGELLCLNGGKCVATEIENEAGQVLKSFHCDCAMAYTEDALFAGPQCEFKSTTLCTQPEPGADLGGVQFCVNGGQCYTDNVLRGCDCPPGWTGIRCEFEFKAVNATDNVTVSEVKECRLQCQNGGHCAEGAKDLGSLQGTVGSVSHLNQTYDEENFEHCVCPEGYIGLQCEHKVDICGENEHVCLHGSTCYKDNDQYACDCSNSDDEVGQGDNQAFAGDSCEHPATDICTLGDNLPGRPLYFCVNQGRCKAYVGPDEPEPGCECPVLWSGPHCEIRAEASSTSSAKLNEGMEVAANSANKGVGVAAISATAVTVTVAVLLIAACFFRRRSASIRFRRRGFEETDSMDKNKSFLGLSRRRDSSNIIPPSSSSGLAMAGFSLTPDEEPEETFQDELSESYDDHPSEQYRDDPVLIRIGRHHGDNNFVDVA